MLQLRTRWSSGYCCSEAAGPFVSAQSAGVSVKCYLDGFIKKKKKKVMEDEPVAMAPVVSGGIVWVQIRGWGLSWQQESMEFVWE